MPSSSRSSEFISLSLLNIPEARSCVAVLSQIRASWRRWDARMRRVLVRLPQNPRSRKRTNNGNFTTPNGKRTYFGVFLYVEA